VNHGFDAFHEFRLRIQQRHGSFNFRRKDKPDRPRWGPHLLSLISFCSVRATSKIVAHPLALSFAPGRW